VYRSKAKGLQRDGIKKQTPYIPNSCVLKSNDIRHISNMKLPDENANDKEPTQKYGQNRAESNKCVVE
jgi:hypothetical protein